MNVADIILTNTTEYNGHKQLQISYNPSYEDALALCKELEEKEPNSSFVVEKDCDGGMAIYQKDFWESGEHPNNHTDRLMCSFGEY